MGPSSPPASYLQILANPKPEGQGRFRCVASPFEPFTQEGLSLLSSLGQTENGAPGIFVLGSTNLFIPTQWLNFICSPVSTCLK